VIAATMPLGSVIWGNFWCHQFAVSGVLKGYDQLLNLVLDETVEYLRGERSHAKWLCVSTWLACHADPEDPTRVTDSTRSLGLVVRRLVALVLAC
jgi:U6 snRNA-associated Sm-like protein LSm7